MRSSLAVRVDTVSKQFRLYHEKPNTLKERFVNMRKAKFEEFHALRNVCLDIESGQTAGLIGANGSGKSTLLKLIAGIIRPDSGTIQTRGRIASLLELGAGFHPDLTGRENVYLNASILGISKKQTDAHFDDIVAFSELEQFIDMHVRHYSSGMYVRLGFAVAVHVDPEILIVDEVLAVGDEGFQRKCMDRIRRFQQEGRTIVFVTHAVDMVKSICSVAYFLDHGQLVAEGAPSEVIRAYRQAVHGEAHLEAAPTEERGNREIQIEAVEFLDEAEVPAEVFYPGQQMAIRLHLYAKHPVSDPIVGFSVYGSKEEHLFGTNTQIADLRLGVVEGHRKVTFRIASLPLLGGDFRLTAGVHNEGSHVVYHWMEKMFPFRVINPGQEEGLVFFPVEIEAQQAFA